MSFVSALLAWYQVNARNLPWRSCHTPYCIWVSEIMLQQTQVDTVIPYFERWMKRFPDIDALARADSEDVLIAWEGLGYYRRAHHLHQAARNVVAEWHGDLPQTPEELILLPGIGPYTAAAIASIAFGVDVAAVDGNIRRVLARIFNVDVPVRSAKGEKTIQFLAKKNVPEGGAGEYNQAMMDLGATICTPKDPACNRCPIAQDCQAKILNLQTERPVVLPRKKIPHLTVTAAVIWRDGQVLIAKRLPGGLLGGLWEFPGGTLEEADIDLHACLKREIQEELGVDIVIRAPFGVYNHAYTHFKISLHAFLCDLVDGHQPRNLESEALIWTEIGSLRDFPMGKVDRQIAERLMEEENVVFSNGS